MTKFPFKAERIYLKDGTDLYFEENGVVEIYDCDGSLAVVNAQQLYEALKARFEKSE